MKRLWAVYRTDTNENPFGRDFVGFTGWHEDATSAMNDARSRYPEVPAAVLQVNRV